MTDPMELVGRLERVVSDRRPGFSLNADPQLLTEAAPCIREMVEWRPIETAPRDGTVFVALSLSHLGERYDSKTFKPYSCWWGGDVEPGWARELHGWRSFGNYVAHPTHWLPLPPAPGAEA